MPRGCIEHHPLPPRPLEHDVHHAFAFEYRNADSQLLGKISVRTREENSADHRERARLAVLQQCGDPLSAEIEAEALFPTDTAHFIEELTLSSANGRVTIDFVELLQLKEARIVMSPMWFGYSYFPDRIVVAPKPETALDLFVLLHEAGHYSQDQDSVFLEEVGKLSDKSPRWTMDSPQVKERERDANRRALQWIDRLQRMGIDLTGEFAIGQQVNDLFDRRVLHNLQLIPEATTIFAAGRMSIRQLINFQLDVRGAYAPQDEHSASELSV